MAVVKSECRDRNTTYTGVKPDCEYRNCAVCSETVEIDPKEKEVRHVDRKE